MSLPDIQDVAVSKAAASPPWRTHRLPRTRRRPPRPPGRSSSNARTSPQGPLLTRPLLELGEDIRLDLLHPLAEPVAKGPHWHLSLESGLELVQDERVELLVRLGPGRG